MAIVAEMSMDDMLAGNIPQSSHVKRLRNAVTQAAASLVENTAITMASDRITKAMDLVLTGAVEAHADVTYTVKSGNRTYEILDERSCQDSQHRLRYCKHYLATKS